MNFVYDVIDRIRGLDDEDDEDYECCESPDDNDGEIPPVWMV